MMAAKAPESLGKDMYVAKNIQHNAGVLNFMCAGTLPDLLPMASSVGLACILQLQLAVTTCASSIGAGI